MESSARLIVAMLVVTVLGAAFWVLALSPKREEASKLGDQVTQLQASLAESQSRIAQAEEARREFPEDYHQMVLLGKAVPGGDDTSSLLVELNRIAERSGVVFDSILLSSEESTEGAASLPTAPEVGATTTAPTSLTPPTEVGAALLPLGATIGPAGLGVMPYDLTFSGDFFQIADFIEGIDSLVKPDGSEVEVDGRLVTLDGFALNEDSKAEFPHLSASFSVTAYLVPPGQGVTAGATPSAPAATATTSLPTPSSTESPAQ